MKRNVLVVGLSALGEALVRALAGRVRLFGVDKTQERVSRLAHIGGVELGCLDASSSASIQAFLPDEAFEAAVVAIGGDFLGAEIVAENLGLLARGRDHSPQFRKIIVTANRPYRAEILAALGHRVVKPMLSAAQSLAVTIAESGVERFTWLAPPASPEGSAYGVGEVSVPSPEHAITSELLEQTFPGIRVLGMRDAPDGPIVSLTRSSAPAARIIVAGEAKQIRAVQEHLEAAAEEARDSGG